MQGRVIERRKLSKENFKVFPMSPQLSTYEHKGEKRVTEKELETEFLGLTQD